MEHLRKGWAALVEQRTAAVASGHAGHPDPHGGRGGPDRRGGHPRADGRADDALGLRRGRVAAPGYTLFVTISARKDHADLSADDRTRITRAVKGLRNDPFPPGSKRLGGALRGYYRLAVGDSLRVFYGVEGTHVTVYGVGQHENFFNRMIRRMGATG